MNNQQLLREIILHMKDIREIEHFCENAENASELCKNDTQIKQHISQMNPDIPRMSKLDKLKIKESYRSSNFPIEIRRKISENIVNPNHLAIECYKDPEFSDICKDYRQSLCKDALIAAKLTVGLSEWDKKYCYLLEELLKLVRIINKNTESQNNLQNLKEICNSYKLSLSLTETDIDQIPIDIINFVQKNNKLKTPFPKDELFIATTEGKYIHVGEILSNFFVPLKIKNHLIKIAVDNFSKNEESYGNIIDSLLFSGATDIFYPIKEAVNTNNLELIIRYSSSSYYLIYYTLKECIITDNAMLIGVLTEQLLQNRFPGFESRRHNLRNKINLPKLISLIYYHKFNHLLPFFKKLASPDDLSKAHILYETKQFEDTFIWL